MKKTNPIIDLIIVGDELLRGRTIDSNSHFLTKELSALGFTMHSVTIIGDTIDEIAAAVCAKYVTADIVIISGGLGPTPDDITRFGLAKALGKELVMVPAALKYIRARLRGVSRRLAKMSEIEALLPKGSTPLKNTVGVAPGCRVKHGECVLFAIPGVPGEARGMFTRNIKPYLVNHFRSTTEVRCIIKTIGMREAQIYSRIKRYVPPTVSLGMYPRGGEVEVQLRARCTHGRQLERVDKKINKILCEHIYSNKSESIEEVIGKILRRNRMTIAVAESCTGGLITKRITDVPGASHYFVGGINAYANTMKASVLCVKAITLKRYGAVSAEVAREMARGIVAVTGARLGVSVTGIAGPTGGTKIKPVGLVYIGIYSASPLREWRFSTPEVEKGVVRVKRLQFRGDRKKIRWLASQAVFNEVWQALK